MKYQNPIIPGFYPDPSVCRVGEDFYLVNSSFEYFPGVPIFHSRDLVHWRQIGHCLTRRSQLPLDNAYASGGIFAPTIRFHDGMFYMTTTNMTHGGNFYVTAHDPAGPWSNPIYVAQGGIDPSLFFDRDGRVYFASTSDEGLQQSSIDIQTGKLRSEARVIWKGTGAQYPEGPHLYHLRGRYYLLIAEGGTEYGHMVCIARGDDPFGPFEGCPRNPILSHRSYFSPIQVTGHADLVQSVDGSFWMVFLAVRPNGHPPTHHLGRETFLAPVQWSEDGWPMVGRDGRVALEMDAGSLPVEPGEQPVASFGKDDFESPELGLQYNFLRNPRDEDWSLSERPGRLRLSCSEVSLADIASPAFIGRRQQHFDCRFKVALDFDPSGEQEEAGITVRMNERHHYDVVVTLRRGRRSVIVRRTIGTLTAEEACAPLASGPVILCISASRDWYELSAGMAGEQPTALARGETRYLSAEVARGFTGVYFGMYATGNGRRSERSAYFDWCEYVEG
jgi:alpha-N-arabinofuranosidase